MQFFINKTQADHFTFVNPLNAELNPIRHLLALAGARHIVHVSRIRVNKGSSEVLLVLHSKILEVR